MIEVENLVKIFHLADQVELFALQGLDVTIAAGEMVGIVGASGSGKSTLLNVVGGLVTPTAGQVRVNGRSMMNMSESQLDLYRRDEVGFVWQQSGRNLISWLNAAENVVYPMVMAGLPRREALSRAEALLQMVGLGDRLDHRIETLSGGEQARVSIAIALANNPTLLLADEPTGELDTDTALMVYDLLRQLNQELGLTMLIVSHDPGIARHVDRVVLIRDGKLAGETVRRVTSPAIDSSDSQNDELEDFEELLVMDNNGRLQLPPDIREEFGFDQRVRWERVDGGVVLRPVVAEEAEEPVEVEASAEAAPVTSGTVEKSEKEAPRGWRWWRGG